MTAKTSSIAIRAGAFTFALCGGVVLSTLVTPSLLPAKSRPLPDIYDAAHYDSATVRISGNLSNAALTSLVPMMRDTSVLVLLRSTDIEGCEDLGRQLRALGHRFGHRWPSIVGADTVGQSGIEYFLAKEHVAGSIVKELGDMDDVVAGTLSLPTPAVLVVLRNGKIVDGIAHSRRFPNFRPRSFAEELTAVK